MCRRLAARGVSVNCRLFARQSSEPNEPLDYVLDIKATTRLDQCIRLYQVAHLGKVSLVILLEFLPSHGQRLEKLLDRDGRPLRSRYFAADHTCTAALKRERCACGSRRCCRGRDGESRGAAQGRECLATETKCQDGGEVVEAGKLGGVMFESCERSCVSISRRQRCRITNAHQCLPNPPCRCRVRCPALQCSPDHAP